MSVDGGGQTKATSGSRRRRRRRRTRAWLWWVGGLAVVLIAVTAWVGIRGMLAKDELEAAVPLARTAQSQVVEGDAEGAMRTTEQLVRHAASAASLTSDPVWRAVEVVPWVGPNLEAMRTIASSVDLVARKAVQPLSAAAAELDLAAFSPSDGRIDLEPIVALRQPVHEAATALSIATSMMTQERVTSAALIGPLSDARAELSALLADADGTIAALDRAVQLLPAMLGADGPRNVLLLFQNNAELRSTGGIPGALALLRTENGAFTMVRQADSSDFPKFEPPVIELPVETRALYGDNTASYIQDVTFTPQFPLSASIAREMWKRQFGDEVNSVIAVDPVVLSHLLVATGPIQLATGDVLSSENAVQLLLHDTYSRFEDSATQDAFFAAVAGAVIVGVSGDKVDPLKLIRALVQSGSERRVLIWNADAEEQAVLAGTTLVGGLPESTSEVEAFGVYLNDMTGAKMDPFLDIRIAAGGIVCRADGRSNYLVEVSLANTAPADAATRFSRFVTGGGLFGTPSGSISTSINVYSAPNNYNLGVRRNGESTDFHPTSDSGYTLSKVVSRLAPGETVAYTFAFLAGEPGERSPVVQSTPSINAIETSSLHTRCEDAVW